MNTLSQAFSTIRATFLAKDNLPALWYTCTYTAALVDYSKIVILPVRAFSKVGGAGIEALYQF